MPDATTHPASGEPELPAASTEQPEQTYPWQVSEPADLDLHGAATWNPDEYRGQPVDDAEARRAKRAMRWLFARSEAPEEADVSASGALPAASLPPVEVPVEVPGTDVAAPRKPRPGPRQEPLSVAADVDAERREADRIEAERLEAERLEAQRREAERLEAERLEAERLEAERLEAERLEAERLEAERLEAQRREAERIEAERLEAERRETERLEAERLAAAAAAAAATGAAVELAHPIEAAAEAPGHAAVDEPSGRPRRLGKLFGRSRQFEDDDDAVTSSYPGESLGLPPPDAPDATEVTGTQPWDAAAEPAEPAAELAQAHDEVDDAHDEGDDHHDGAPPSGGGSGPDRRRPRPGPGMATAVTQPLTPATGTPSTLARTGPAHAAPVLAHADPAAASAPQATSAERLTRPVDDPQLRKFLEASEPQDGDDEKEGSRWRPSRKTVRSLTRLGVVVAIIVAAVLVLRTWIVSPYYIPSESMEPTLHGCGGCNNDRVLVEKISYDVGSIHTGDIVVFNRPKTAGPEITDKVLIKRVIGVGGDQIAVRGGHVFVNSRLLQEPYVKTTAQCRHQSTQPLTATSHWIVPSGDVFVLGDNRCDSIDSRVFGPIPDSSVIGRAFMIYWPFHRIGFLH